MEETLPRIIEDPEYGYRRLESPPSPEETGRFYQSRYYELLRSGRRAPELARLLAGGAEAERERDWLEKTLYDDLACLLEEHAPGRRVLDVGCGLGLLVDFLRRRGFQAFGVEPSEEAAEAARRKGLPVRVGTLEEYCAGESGKGRGSFDALLMVNVLEHAPGPDGLLRLGRELLAPKGVLAARVPNDFSPLQLAAQLRLGLEPWWIAAPDHVNYFSFSSLRRLLEKTGFEAFYAQGDYPMEFFLLMGEVYIGRPETGKACHEKRRAFELSLSGRERRRLYASLAAAEAGRNCLMLARVRA